MYFKGISTAISGSLSDTHSPSVDLETNADDVFTDKDEEEKSIELEMTRLVSSSSFSSDSDSGSSSPYPLDFFKNITNQPTFASIGGTCDNMIRFFDTSMSKGKFAPVSVMGRVKAVNTFPFVEEGELNSGSNAATSQGGEKEWEWTKVYGVQVATPFIENNYLDCETMRGYDGWTAPDRMMMDDL